MYRFKVWHVCSCMCVCICVYVCLSYLNYVVNCVYPWGKIYNCLLLSLSLNFMLIIFSFKRVNQYFCFFFIVIVVIWFITLKLLNFAVIKQTTNEKWRVCLVSIVTHIFSYATRFSTVNRRDYVCLGEKNFVDMFTWYREGNSYWGIFHRNFLTDVNCM